MLTDPITRYEDREFVSADGLDAWTWVHIEPDGPWNGEPDKMHWVDKATGLDCLIVRGPWGALCGYVGVQPGHPYHELGDYYQYDVSVHGGVTFSELCAEDGGDICHVPKPGMPENVWWIGFDCSHGQDISPGMPGYFDRTLGMLGGPPTYKDINYVRGQIEDLAKQLGGIGHQTQLDRIERRATEDA